MGGRRTTLTTRPSSIVFPLDHRLKAGHGGFGLMTRKSGPRQPLRQSHRILEHLCRQHARIGDKSSNLYCHSRESGNPTLRDHRYFVYLLASAPYGTLYVGVTGNLAGRMVEHRESLREGFTKKHGVHHLVWFEEFSDVYDAIRREKQIKKWNRAWKIEMIEKANPVWEDLFLQIV